jgi:FkbM family methyltransferase
MIDHYNCLAKNTAKFSNVKCFNNAMSNESRMLHGAYRTMKNSGSFQLVDDEFVAVNRKNAKIYDIPSKRLDDFKLDNVDMIKIDVEGWEFEVLKGAEQTIRRCQPILMVEYTHGGGRENKSMHTYDVAEYQAFVNSLGYREIIELGGDTIYGPK